VTSIDQENLCYDVYDFVLALVSAGLQSFHVMNAGDQDARNEALKSVRSRERMERECVPLVSGLRGLGEPWTSFIMLPHTP